MAANERCDTCASRANDTTHDADILHRIAQIDKIRADNREDSNDAGIVEQEEENLAPDAGNGEEPDEVGKADFLVGSLRFDMKIAIAVKRKHGEKHKDSHEREDIVPAETLKESEKESGTNECSAKTAERLHRVDKTLLGLAEREDSEGVSSNVLRSRSNERDEDESDDEREVGLEVEMSDKQYYGGIDTLGDKDALAESVNSRASAVDDR